MPTTRYRIKEPEDLRAKLRASMEEFSVWLGYSPLAYRRAIERRNVTLPMTRAIVRLAADRGVAFDPDSFRPAAGNGEVKSR